MPSAGGAAGAFWNGGGVAGGNVPDRCCCFFVTRDIAVKCIVAGRKGRNSMSTDCQVQMSTEDAPLVGNLEVMKRGALYSPCGW